MSPCSSIPQGGYRRDDPHSGPVSPKPGAEPPHSPAALPLTAKPPIIRSPSPRAGLCPPTPSGATPQPSARLPSSSCTPVTPRRTSSVPADYQDTVPEEYEEKIKKPKSQSQGSTQDSRPATPMSDASGRISVRASPKLVRAGSRIFERLQYFEERRGSLEQADSPFPARPWLPLRKTRSFDQPGWERRAGTPGGWRDGEGSAASRRQAFRQKAASFDERGKFAGRVQDIEHKFSEELSRIKRTVSKQQLRRSQELGKAEPQPPAEPPAARTPRGSAVPRKAQPAKASSPAEGTHVIQHLALSSVALVGPNGEPEPGGQRARRGPARGGVVEEARKAAQQDGGGEVRKKEQWLLAQATPRGRVAEGTPCPDGGPVAASRAPGVASEGLAARLAVPHGLYRRPEVPAEVRFLPWAKPGMEQEARLERSWAGQHGTGKEVDRRQAKVAEKKESVRMSQEGRGTRSKGKGHRARPTSPELGRAQLLSRAQGVLWCCHTSLSPRGAQRGSGPCAHPAHGRGAISPCAESSDDSYVSAGEDPLEAPVFEIPIQDTAVAVGTEVLLKCIVTANPQPEGEWSQGTRAQRAPARSPCLSQALGAT